MPAVNGNPVINVAVPVPQPVSPPPTPDRRPTPVSPRKPARPTRAKDNDPDEALVQQQQAAAAQQQQVLAQPALRAVIMPWTPDDAVATSPAPKPAKMTPFRRQGHPIPEPPESHRPQPTQMSRLPKRVVRFKR